MIGPLLAGIIIANMTENNGYTVIFLISLILFVGAFSISFFLKRRKAAGVFQFKKILLERLKNPNWNKILIAHMSQGLREGMFFFIITIWVFLITTSEFALGIFNLLLSGSSLLFYFLVTKFIKPTTRKKAILIGGLLLYFPIYIILIFKSYLSIFIYAILVGL